jgi:hypothetical protein
MEEARAAIEAMREPTPEMVEAAGFVPLDENCPTCGYDGMWGLDSSDEAMERFKEFWEPALSAALKGDE